jgi:hypothetical protein
VVEHPCQQHRLGLHTLGCRTGVCGFCQGELPGSGGVECRACRLILCHSCDGRFQPELGALCRPCTPPAHDPHPDAAQELFRLCVFELSLTCGHVATVALTGWYPVSVACCDRLGGTIRNGLYVPFSSDVDYVEVVSERYEYRPAATPAAPTRLINRRPRIDNPYPGTVPGVASAGRYPARVGATCIC